MLATTLLQDDDGAAGVGIEFGLEVVRGGEDDVPSSFWRCVAANTVGHGNDLTPNTQGRSRMR